jgi:hypothetical protein
MLYLRSINHFILISLALLGLSVTSANAALYVLSGNMDVFQATTNPANVGMGTGTISGDYDDVTNVLNYSIEWMDLSSQITTMHFHLGSAGTSGGVVLSIPGPWASPQLGGDIVLNHSSEIGLLADNWYVNVHTLNFGGGEIRGQVMANLPPSAVPVPAAIWLFGTALIGLVGFGKRRKAA